MSRGLKASIEILILLIVCLAPWAFGGVDAWAGFALGVAILGLTVLTSVSAWNTNRWRALWCVPSLALAGLVLLGAWQAASLPTPLWRALAPTESALRSSLVPGQVDRVAGDRQPPVPLPRPTLSQNPEFTRSAACRLAGAWLLFQAVLCLKDPRASFRRFGVVTAVNACLLSLVSVLQWLSWNGKVLWIREAPRPDNPWYSGGPFASHNHLAAYLNLGLGCLLGLILSSARGNPWFAKRGARLWPAYGAGVLLAGLIASHSRGGVLAAAAALVAVLGIAWVQGGSRSASDAEFWRRGRRGVKPALGLLALMLVTVLLTFLMTGNQSPFARLASLSEAGSDIRWVVWRLSIASWWDRPVWGAGLGAFALAVAPYETKNYAHTYARAENEYLDVLVEGGIIGFGLVLLALGGIIVLVRRALAVTLVPHERALILGACFSGLALLFQWSCDFSFHVPAVAINAIVLAGLLCGMGLDAGAVDGAARTTMSRRMAGWTCGLALPVLGLFALVPGYREARAELALWRAGLPLPEASRGQDRWESRELAGLEKATGALERALEARPDWAEGHLRAGVVWLRRYELMAADLIRSEVSDPAQVEALANPLWLRNQVHGGSAGLVVPVEELLEQEPIRSCLVPAARSFLEARRCCPSLAVAHVELAALDYLLEGNDPAQVSIRRALRLAGTNPYVLQMAAELAAQTDDLDLASRCWRRRLESDETAWEPVADAVGIVLTPEEILRDILPPDAGQLTLAFADRLFQTPETRQARTLFLRAALERLPRDPRVSPATLLFTEGMAQVGLGHRDQGQAKIEEALMLDSLQPVWRQKLVEILIESEQWKRAHTQIAVGLELDPGNAELLSAQQRVIEALARGKTSDSGADRVRQTMAVSHGDR